MDEARRGRRLLHNILAAHLGAWCLTFLLKEQMATPALTFQLLAWVLAPLGLVRAARQGRGWARWLFAAFLVFHALGNVLGLMMWFRVPARSNEDTEKFFISGIFAVLYIASTAVVVLSPAVGRAVASGKSARSPRPENRARPS